MTSPLVHEKVWLDKNKFDDAERQYFEKLAKLVSNGINKHNGSASTDPKMIKVNSKVLTKTPALPNIANVPNIPSIEKGKPVNPTNASEPNNVPSGTSETRLKPKDAKEKRNKADKKGREKRIAVKEDAKGSPNPPSKNSLAGEVAKARQHIKHSLECMDNVAALTGNANVDLVTRVEFLERDNAALHRKIDEILQSMGKQLDKTLNQNTPTKTEEEVSEEKRAAAVQAYNIKKASKPVLIAKSNIILDVKPWDDETNMKDLEARVREVSCDGLLWGASKLVPLAYGIHKLQISCVVEDEKVSIDWLQETLEAIEELVQSVDIAAFNKV